MATKEGYGNRVGRLRSPEDVRGELRDVVRDAVAAADAQVWAPAGPYVLEADVASTALAEVCALAPGTERAAPRTVAFATEDLRTLYRMALTWVNLGRRVAPAYPAE